MYKSVLRCPSPVFHICRRSLHILALDMWPRSVVCLYTLLKVSFDGGHWLVVPSSTFNGSGIFSGLCMSSFPLIGLLWVCYIQIIKVHLSISKTLIQLHLQSSFAMEVTNIFTSSGDEAVDILLG